MQSRIASIKRNYSLIHNCLREGANMTSERKVAVITGASRGIGAGLLKAYRDIGYHVVATSRSIGKSEDPPL